QSISDWRNRTARSECRTRGPAARGCPRPEAEQLLAAARASGDRRKQVTARRGSLPGREFRTHFRVGRLSGPGVAGGQDDRNPAGVPSCVGALCRTESFEPISMPAAPQRTALLALGCPRFGLAARKKPPENRTFL